MPLPRRYTPLIALAAISVAPLSAAPLRPARAASTLTVTSTADVSAPCTPTAFTLLCAINQADKDVSGDTIAFNIPSTDPGCVRTVIQQTAVFICTISPFANAQQHHFGALPALFVNHTTIDGYTQPGARPNTNPAGQGDNAIVAIRIDGTKGGLSIGDGLDVFGSGNTVRGLSITNFANGPGLHIDQGFPNTIALHNTVAGNFLGIAPDGTTGGANSSNVDLGIGTGSDTVGGTGPADANELGGGAMVHTGPTLGVEIDPAPSNTSGAGPNDYTPCPVITTATTTTVSGTACVTCTVEVYGASNEADDVGHGEGQTFLGTATPDGSGHWNLSLPAGKVAVGQEVTASATTRATASIPAETSEFAANVAVRS